jgi:hypothetical protein
LVCDKEVEAPATPSAGLTEGDKEQGIKNLCFFTWFEYEILETDAKYYFAVACS